jgi:hypothetical protein
MRTAWYRTGRRSMPVGFPRPDFTITGLHEILSIV